MSTFRVAVIVAVVVVAIVEVVVVVVVVVVIVVFVVVSLHPGDLWPRKYVKWQAVACITHQTSVAVAVADPSGQPSRGYFVCHSRSLRIVSRALHQWLISRAVPGLGRLLKPDVNYYTTPTRGTLVRWYIRVKYYLQCRDDIQGDKTGGPNFKLERNRYDAML